MSAVIARMNNADVLMALLGFVLAACVIAAGAPK